MTNSAVNKTGNLMNILSAVLPFTFANFTDAILYENILLFVSDLVILNLQVLLRYMDISLPSVLLL